MTEHLIAGIYQAAAGTRAWSHVLGDITGKLGLLGCQFVGDVAQNLAPRPGARRCLVDASNGVLSHPLPLRPARGSACALYRLPPVSG